MKKPLALIFLLLALPMTVFAKAFVEGKDYTRLPASFEKSSEPTLTEVFSVYCHSCYRWDQEMIDSVKSQMAGKDVEFKQKHIAYVAEFGDRASEALAIVQGTAQAEKIKDALFEAVQKDSAGEWENEKAFFATLEKSGMSKETFQKGLKDPAVQARLKKWKMYEEALPSVPSFVVNGQYLVNMNSIRSFDQFYALIDYLLTL
ncbi:thioredoxin domain-containing protein [Endozoicomonas arenosclerae]|uniref:thioredoxin domain-containing protein n=1 Tax=Endozoicomonas arenosclerae TaxID=1633495 RepID=UPI00078165DD|nr:thioredoxin domain-containing protein [Endozoicomonas arenosclerae]